MTEKQVTAKRKGILFSQMIDSPYSCPSCQKKTRFRYDSEIDNDVEYQLTCPDLTCGYESQDYKNVEDLEECEDIMQEHRKNSTL